MERKIFLFFIIVLTLIFTPIAFAQDLSTSIDGIISQSGVKDSAIISVSVRDLKTSDVIYEKDSKRLIRPASTLKAFTTAMALDYLDDNYRFETYFSRNGDKFYLKLSGDPMFDEKSLQTLVAELRTQNVKAVEELTIDSSAIDAMSWGEGWQWDDNINPLMPQISPYNINHNLIALQIGYDDKADKITIVSVPRYDEYVLGNLRKGNKTTIEISRNIMIKPSYTILKGTVSGPQSILIPVSNPADFFVTRFMSNFERYNIGLNPVFKYDKVATLSYKAAVVSHGLLEVIDFTNKNSDNLAAEVILKHVGAQSTGNTGTTKDGIFIFNKFYTKLGAETSGLAVVDASGVSLNDLLTTNWMSLALSKLSNTRYFSKFKNTLADPEVGTFKGRTPELTGKIKVKTGSLTGVSAVTGYLTTKSGRDVTFAVTVQNYKEGTVNPKNIENQIINAIYNEI